MLSLSYPQLVCSFLKRSCFSYLIVPERRKPPFGQESECSIENLVPQNKLMEHERVGR